MARAVACKDPDLHGRATRGVDEASANDYPSSRFSTRGAASKGRRAIEETVGSVIKKRRKKMRKHKKRKLLKRARHKRKR